MELANQRSSRKDSELESSVLDEVRSSGCDDEKGNEKRSAWNHKTLVDKFGLSDRAVAGNVAKVGYDAEAAKEVMCK